MSSIKLTLHIQDSVINKAKQYAKRQNVSLSKIVEHYLALLADEEASAAPVSLWTEDLAAVETAVPDFDHKVDYRDHILKKYEA